MSHAEARNQPGRSPTSSITGLWVDAKSVPQVYLPNDGLYELTAGGWQRRQSSPGVGEENAPETEQFPKRY